MSQTAILPADVRIEAIGDGVWRTPDGRFWGSEVDAREAGCTHKSCECGKPYPKGRRSYSLCDECFSESKNRAFDISPAKEWNLSDPVCEWDGDRCFFCEEDLLYECEERGIQPREMRLVLCEPLYPREIDLDVLWCDDLPEDTTARDADSEIAGAVDKVNELIRKRKADSKPLCWVPGGDRVICSAVIEMEGEQNAK